MIRQRSENMDLSILESEEDRLRATGFISKKQPAA